MTTEIIIVSDNHYSEEPLREVMRAHPKADYFIHCGDSQMPRSELRGFACVRGNNDFDNSLEYELVLTIDQHRLYITHGHREGVWGDLSVLVHKAKQRNCDIVCFGHTHIYHDEVIDGIRLLNPGSVWRNRDGSAPSYMRMILAEDVIVVDRLSLKKKGYFELFK